jgi:hypothetical protein
MSISSFFEAFCLVRIAAKKKCMLFPVAGILQGLKMSKSPMGTLLQRFTCISLLTCAVFLGHGKLQAQVNYLEPIGGTEVELFFFLNAEPGSDLFQRDGQQLKLEEDGMDATYTVTRGKVTNVAYHQIFTSSAKAEQAYLHIRKFMESKGMKIQDVREAVAHRVVSGAGGGMNGTLILVPIAGGGYHVNAEISAMR